MDKLKSELKKRFISAPMTVRVINWALLVMALVVIANLIWLNVIV
jgi:hypothetical protein